LALISSLSISVKTSGKLHDFYSISSISITD
jgi:hypothetical protein